MGQATTVGPPGRVIRGWRPAVQRYRRRSGGVRARTSHQLLALREGPWRVLRDVPVDRDRIEHVVVGPDRVFAIASTWVFSQGLQLEGAASRLERQADRLADVLGDRGVDREVIPMLAVSGPGAEEELASRPRLLGTTRVVAAGEASRWLERMTAGARWSSADGVSYRVLAGEG
jgi:hypothetical protein